MPLLKSKILKNISNNEIINIKLIVFFTGKKKLETKSVFPNINKEIIGKNIF